MVARANDTQAGLAAYFFTKNVKRTWRVAEALDYGMLVRLWVAYRIHPLTFILFQGVNTSHISNEAAPFGGRKDSGLGREGGLSHGINEYLDVKYLCWELGPDN